MSTKAVLAVVAVTAIAGTAGAVGHARASRSSPRCSSIAVVTHLSNQDPAAVRKYWTPQRILQAQENMRRASGARASARSCDTGS